MGEIDLIVSISLKSYWSFYGLFCLNDQKTSNGFSRDIAASITAQCEAYGDKRSVFGQRCI